MTWFRLLMGLFVLGAALYVAALVWVYFRQEVLLFHPETLPAGHQFVRSSDVHERGIEVPGATLSVLELRLASPKGVVFFLHGNAGNLETWFVNLDLYRRLNYDLVMLDYRGYGKSTGLIQSETQLRADVRAVWDNIAPRYENKVRVVYGRSLGTALAARLAREVQPDLSVLVSPYFSMGDLARQHFALIPSHLLRYPLRTGDDVAQHPTPLLLVHGERDTLISPQHSERLQALAPHAQLLRLPEAAHNDVHQFEAYLQAFRAALDALPSRSQTR